jgi:hypothetical protein
LKILPPFRRDLDQVVRDENEVMSLQGREDRDPLLSIDDEGLEVGIDEIYGDRLLQGAQPVKYELSRANKEQVQIAVLPQERRSRVRTGEGGRSAEPAEG